MFNYCLLCLYCFKLRFGFWVLFVGGFCLQFWFFSVWLICFVFCFVFLLSFLRCVWLVFMFRLVICIWILRCDLLCPLSLWCFWLAIDCLIFVGLRFFLFFTWCALFAGLIWLRFLGFIFDYLDFTFGVFYLVLLLSFAGGDLVILGCVVQNCLRIFVFLWLFGWLRWCFWILFFMFCFIMNLMFRVCVLFAFGFVFGVYIFTSFFGVFWFYCCLHFGFEFLGLLQYVFLSFCCKLWFADLWFVWFSLLVDLLGGFCMCFEFVGFS